MADKTILEERIDRAKERLARLEREVAEQKRFIALLEADLAQGKDK